MLDGELTIGDRGRGAAGSARTASCASRPASAASSSTAGPATLLLLALGADGEHVGRDARAWESWDEDGDAGRTPQEVPLPADLPV